MRRTKTPGKQGCDPVAVGGNKNLRDSILGISLHQISKLSIEIKLGWQFFVGRSFSIGYQVTVIKFLCTQFSDNPRSTYPSDLDHHPKRNPLNAAGIAPTENIPSAEIESGVPIV